MQDILSKRLSEQIKEIKLIPECYANKCIANKLYEILKRQLRQHISILHNYKHGRDRIISKILKSPLAEQALIAVIDYERGISRIYIDEHFELEKVINYIFIDISKHDPKVMAIIFDPRIEEAFVCRVSKELCKNPFLLEQIRSRNACNILKKVVDKNKEAKDIIYKLSEKLIKLLT
jgi:gamma-glutamyl phosphate reductase